MFTSVFPLNQSLKSQTPRLQFRCFPFREEHGKSTPASPQRHRKVLPLPPPHKTQNCFQPMNPPNCPRANPIPMTGFTSGGGHCHGVSRFDLRAPHCGGDRGGHGRRQLAGGGGGVAGAASGLRQAGTGNANEASCSATKSFLGRMRVWRWAVSWPHARGNSSLRNFGALSFRVGTPWPRTTSLSR